MNEAAACDQAVIRASGLTKRFGLRRALRGIDLSVLRGQRVALFGANGAGKTTLLRILTLALKPDSGTILVDGLTPRDHGRRIRSLVGVLTHQSYLYDDLTLEQNLTFFAQLYGVPDCSGRVRALLERFDLVRRTEDPVRTLSRGLQQRAAVARAIVHDPPLLLLDEPFSGLDPRAAASLAELIEARDRTILLATHDLSRGLRLSDRFILLERGRVAAEGDSRQADPVALEADHFRGTPVTARGAHS